MLLNGEKELQKKEELNSTLNWVCWTWRRERDAISVRCRL